MSPTAQSAWRPAVCSPKRRREKARQKVMRGKSRVRVGCDEESANSLPYRVTAESGCARSTSSNALSSWRWKAQTTRSKGSGEVGLVRTRLSSFGDPPGWKRAARRQHLRRECRLWEIARVERHQEIGGSLLRASTEWVVRRIRRDLRKCTRRDQRGFFAQQVFAQQVDEHANRLTTDFQSPQDDLVLRKRLFGDDPSESATLDPVPEKLRSGIGLRNGFRAEAGDPCDENRSVNAPLGRLERAVGNDRHLWKRFADTAARPHRLDDRCGREIAYLLGGIFKRPAHLDLPARAPSTAWLIGQRERLGELFFHLTRQAAQ